MEASYFSESAPRPIDRRAESSESAREETALCILPAELGTGYRRASLIVREDIKDSSPEKQALIISEVQHE